MKLLLSQREILVPNSMGIEMQLDAVERSWHSFLKNHEVTVFPNVVNIPENLDFDCLILTGGPDSIARHRTENALFEFALDRNRPIVGICHGAFAINDLTGGINGRITGHESCFHQVIINQQEYTVNSHHVQVIESLGQEMIPIAVDFDGNIEAFQHQTKPIYGIVWHPERMSFPVLIPDVKELLNL
jgi:GMP synthase-like glutamine amidotransferase